MGHKYIKNKRSKRIHIQYPHASNNVSVCRRLDTNIIEASKKEFNFNPCKECRQLIIIWDRQRHKKGVFI